jgi:hypothetical protein
VGALVSACERALWRAARSRGLGTRQQVRARARSFVRRHRRDSAYLHWVVRSVTSSSALAVALLGLAADPAGAATAPFAARTGSANPLNAKDVGQYSAPALADLDGDGDLDVISGELSGLVYYFENTGTATIASFVQKTGVANPFSGQNFGHWSIPALADLDADGDLDTLFGDANGQFSYFENTGSRTIPAFLARTGSANPLDAEQVAGNAVPAFGDLDGDGDLDLLAGAGDGLFHYLENTGSATAPAFAERTGSANPLDGQGVGLGATPSLVDVDRDGDLDVLSSESVGGTFVYYENTGTRTSPAFVARTGVANPMGGLPVPANPTTLATGDLDGDGDPDLISGAQNGTFAYFQNRAGTTLVGRTGALNPLDGQSVSGHSAPAFGDLDGDSDLDLISGNSDGTFAYYENTGSRKNPAFAIRTGGANPLDGQNVASSVSRPSLADLDGDGDLDMIAGGSNGVFHYFENTGNASSPAFIQRTGADDPLDGVSVASFTAPSFGDLDGDGDLDVVVVAANSNLSYYENTGSASTPAFVARSGAANPFNGTTLISAMPSLADMDGDGDLDLGVGFGGIVRYLENTGTRTSPAFVSRTGLANPLRDVVVGYSAAPALADLDGDGDVDAVVGNDAGAFSYYESFVPQPPPAIAITGFGDPLRGQDVGALSAPALADLDHDGDADVVAGESLGGFFYYENTGTAALAHFVARTGVANPLDGRNVGSEAKPAFADIDGDGDPDLLVGRETGDFVYFENTGDAEHPLFAAPVPNPFGLGNVGSHSAPAFGDLDGDGDLDLAVGDYYGGFTYFENIGDGTNPFFDRVGASDPLRSIDVAYYSTPTLADADGDGDLDLVSGAEHGRLFVFRNTGTAIAPAFGPVGNPIDLAGIDVGDRSAPAAGDLNGDGRPDLVTGATAGGFAVHYLPEPRRGFLLGAGIALLSLLDRARRRSSR